QFLTVMSHEMRTPLNGVLGVLDLLKSTKLTPHQQRYAQIATSSSEVLLEHVNEALDITRIETGKLHLALQDFDLAEVMRGLMDMFEPLAQEKDLSCTLTIEEAMRRRFYGDAGRLRQILTNLIGNAIKFTETGGVHIAVHGINGPETSSLRFEVSDTGIGVPADQQEQVFEDFFAIASSEGRQDRGDGLGLSISRRIARAMDGDVTMRTAQDAGSTFVLTLPLLRSEGHAVARAGDADAPAQACNILIVEDNIINRGVLGDMLLAMGHHVSEAVNGADCLEKAQDQRFDIIFMDIGMPVMNGIDATQRLRAADGPNAKTHVIGLTAHGREDYRDTALTAGMNRFHTKPIRLDALHSIIAELTSGPLTKDEPAKVGDALQEMLDVLGPEKVRNVADAFLAELATLVSDLRAGADTAKPEVLAEAAHKAKGASSLLGQVDLEDELGALEIAARAGALSDASGWADRLAHGASTSAAVFDTVIPTTASSKVD
ncbi:MAG: ATP-binding protein, partial [Pseudomonadota bacterium]